MTLDVADYNSRWLQCWTNKDIPGLLGFYDKDVAYFDPQTGDGIHGHAALEAYLTTLFAATPPVLYDPHEVWATHNGFCGRWYGTISMPDGTKTHMRGFDIVVLKGDKIVLNEVYVHTLTALPSPVG